MRKVPSLAGHLAAQAMLCCSQTGQDKKPDEAICRAHLAAAALGGGMVVRKVASLAGDLAAQKTLPGMDSTSTQSCNGTGWQGTYLPQQLWAEA